MKLKVKERQGGLERTQRRQAEEESVKVGLSMDDALCPSKFIVGINLMAATLR